MLNSVNLPSVSVMTLLFVTLLVHIEGFLCNSLNIFDDVVSCNIALADVGK